MKLIELLPLIDTPYVVIYEKTTIFSRFIVTMNPRKDKGYVSDELLERVIDSISYDSNHGFKIFLCKEKDGEVGE